ncbi:regulator of G-protein signaling 13 isoform X1 [Corvus hawaiiensis]|uniref:regulator of G-protein signaling 13 isoform X1 n=1 Tax=Corvus hawaiiensis TaxID=134902 RepID=UPI002018E601|nr:regulator of G-protein signaling 13 isoform X1 [Corvus hawaiiensis]
MSSNTCWICKIFRAEENGISSKVSLEEVLQWSRSFENLVTSKYGPMIYKTYLKTEHSDENIEFWLACEAYKKITSQKKRISVARKLFTSYIQPQAPNEINIDSPARKAIMRNIQEPTQSCFDEAQRIIYRHIERDSYPRFLESQFYQKLKQSLQTNGNKSMVT